MRPMVDFRHRTKVGIVGQHDFLQSVECDIGDRYEPPTAWSKQITNVRPTGDFNVQLNGDFSLLYQPNFMSV